MKVPLPVMLVPIALGLLLGACSEGPSGRSTAKPAAVEPAELDFGEDWASAEQGRNGLQPAGSGRPRGGGGESAAQSVWGIVLMSSSDEGHETAARTMLSGLSRVSAKVAAGAWTHSGEKGSVVVFGRYRAPQDAAAQRDLKWIKSLERDGTPVFMWAMIGRVIEGQPSSQSPFSLHRVREMYPDVDPLYTLEVAVWGVFDSPMKLEEAQKKAEAYCQELRTKGYEAYFHHNVDKQISTVTVGVFGPGAIDPEANLFSPEVDAVRRHFPARLVNGESFREPDPGRAGRSLRVQEPRLVLVP